MRSIFHALLLVAISSAVFVACGSDSGGDDSSSPAAAASADHPNFDANIHPILVANCAACHAAGGISGVAFFAQDDANAAYNELMNGERVVPGDSAASKLYDRISGDPQTGDAMPTSGDPLSSAQVEKIKKWIDNGAE